MSEGLEPGLPAVSRLRKDRRTRPLRGRLHAERESATRTPFGRDRDRIIHCGAFRRLALKTQVFLPEAGDGYRTRLTHTIEVAQISRAIARALDLDEDLTEALALAHDLGHAPFGHTGEDALDAAMREVGGFDHNAQTLRILTKLERRYPDFPGLNLTVETLQGLVQRAGPSPRKGVPPPVRRLAERLGCDLDTWASLEAQVSAIADDIAYNAHDLEDGLDAGLFTLTDVEGVPELGGILGRAFEGVPRGDRNLMTRALARTMIGAFVEDVLDESEVRLAAPRGGPAIGLSAPFAAASRAAKSFLREAMYVHPRLLKTRAQAFAIVTDLAVHWTSRPGDLPAVGPALATGRPSPERRLRAIADHVAGLTDRAAVAEHRRLFATTPDLR